MLLCEGFRWRERRDLEARAWELAYILRAWGSKVEPKDLLPTAENNVTKFEHLAGIK